MTNSESNFNQEGAVPAAPSGSRIEEIVQSLNPMIENAPEEELSPNLYVTLPDGTHEFLPKRDIYARFDDPSVEYVNPEGEVVVEHLGPDSGKFEAIGLQPHFEETKKPDDYDPRQTEFGFAGDGSVEKKVEKHVVKKKEYYEWD